MPNEPIKWVAVEEARCCGVASAVDSPPAQLPLYICSAEPMHRTGDKIASKNDKDAQMSSAIISQEPFADSVSA